MNPWMIAREGEKAAPGTLKPALSFKYGTVIAAWAVCSTITFLYVAYSAVNMPFQDDYRFTDVFSGAESLRFDWLWKRHAGHAFPLTRLLVTLICRATDFDLRIVFLLSAVLICSASLMLLLAAAFARGRASIFDLIIVLHTGSILHFWSLLQGINLSFTLYLFLFSAILAGMLCQFWRSTILSSAMAVAFILLPVHGGYGLAASLVFTPYLAVVAFLLLIRGRREARLRGSILGVAALISAAGCLWAVFPFVRDALEGSGASKDWPEVIKVSSKALAMGWPRVGKVEFRHGLVALTTAGTVAFGLWMIVFDRQNRPVLLSLSTAFLAIGAVGGAIGWGRAGWTSWAGSAIWYATLSAPFPLIAYLILDRVPFRPLRLVFVSGLLILAFAAVSETWDFAWRIGSKRRIAGQYLVSDALGGVSGTELHNRYHRAFLPWDGSLNMEPVLEILKRRAQGPYDENKTQWLASIQSARVAKVHLGPRTNADGVRPVGGGGVAFLDTGCVLSVVDGDTWFYLPTGQGNAAPDARIEILMLSPAATQMRFRAGDRWIQVEPIERGANLVVVHLPSTVEQDGEIQFSPGEVPGNYRVRAVRRYRAP